MSRAFFRLSGRLRVEFDGTDVPIGPAAVQGLLAALLLADGDYLSRDWLVEELWDDPPKSALDNLRGYVWRLRQALGTADPALGGMLTTLNGGRGGYALHIPSDNVDIAVFKRLAGRGGDQLRAGELVAATDTFHRALALWRGSVGQGCMASARLRARFASLDKLQLTVREKVARVHLLQGESTELLPDLQDLITEAPFRETPWALLIRACYLGGDIDGAVTAWQEGTSMLATQFGLEPSQELKNLYLAILRRDEDAVRAFGER